MIDSRWSAEVIDNARHHDAYNPYKEINVDEPRFKSRLGRNHVRFQQGKHDNEENTGEHVCDKFCHTLKIHQSNAIDVNSLQKRECDTRFNWILRADALRMTHHSHQSTAYCLLHPPSLSSLVCSGIAAFFRLITIFPLV